MYDTDAQFTVSYPLVGHALGEGATLLEDLAAGLLQGLEEVDELVGGPVHLGADPAGAGGRSVWMPGVWRESQ